MRRPVLTHKIDALADWICAGLALAGLMIFISLDMNVRSSEGSASDFKTLYASAWCFAHHLNAYDMSNIRTIFLANGVVAPHQWYGHMPVYPPFTLAVLAPLTWLSMVQAAYVGLIVSAGLMALAAGLLCRAARNLFNLSLPWRLLIVAACGASPALGFGLVLVNVSVAVAALSIIAILAPPRVSKWIPAGALALALLLKPHIAIWVWLALLLGEAWRRKEGAATALRAAGIGLAAGVVVLGWLAAQHTLTLQLHGYHDILWSETHGGSMSPINFEELDTASQITSLITMLGCWMTNLKALAVLNLICLGALAFMLLRDTVKLRSTDAGPQDRLLLIGCWCGFGLIATYHRAHDATVLLPLLPWVAARLQASLKDWGAWGVVLLYAAIAGGPSEDQLMALSAYPHLGLISQLIFYRQSSIAAVALELLLLYLLRRTIKGRTAEFERFAFEDGTTVPEYSEA